jgi:hypothetical protein
MSARIYRIGKSATQSGAARAGTWVLEHEAEQAREIEPLMGWTSSADMKSQIRLNFQSKEEAVAYAARNGVPARVVEPAESSRKAISYSDNFKSTRLGQWTH